MSRPVFTSQLLGSIQLRGSRTAMSASYILFRPRETCLTCIQHHFDVSGPVLRSVRCSVFAVSMCWTCAKNDVVAVPSFP